jgi:hypothetical protein
VEEEGAFWAPNQCGSKPLWMAPKSCVLIVSYPTTMCGHPLVVKVHLDPEEGSSNERGLNFSSRIHFLI